MKKNVEWAKNRIKNTLKFEALNDREVGFKTAMQEALEIIDQLDEPETISEEWINKHKREYDEYPSGSPVLLVDDVKEVLVPKQEITEEQALDVLEDKGYTIARKHEDDGVTVIPFDFYRRVLNLNGYIVIEKPVIPQFVADWLDDNIERYKTVYSFIISLVEVFGDTVPEEVWTYASENPDTMARAYLDGYEVAAEQRYYVMNNDNRMMLVRMMDGKTITEADPFPFGELYDDEKKSHRLSESEIKDYDPRYWAFKEPVEEAEFRLSF